MKSSSCRPPSHSPIQTSRLRREQAALEALLRRVPWRWAPPLQVEPARTLAGPGVIAARTSRTPRPSCCHCRARMCPVEQIFIIKTHCHQLLFEFFLILQPCNKPRARCDQTTPLPWARLSPGLEQTVPHHSVLHWECDGGAKS